MQEVSKKITCWVVSEGIAGTENQCLGVTEVLGVEPVVKRIALNEPWKTFSPYIGFEQSWSFSPTLVSPWPDLVIAAGRKAIAACRYIKAQSPSTFVTFIQDPRIDPQDFDLVAVPAHDPTRGDNVIVTTASPNRLSEAKLDQAKLDWDQTFGALKAPKVAVLIGGNSKAYRFTPEVANTLAEQLSGLNAGLMITASRRTGAENEATLREALKDHYFWDGKGENPYFGMLAHADFILVTADSASMLSEACSTGRPVYMISMDAKGIKGHPRIDKLHENLRQSGALRDFQGNLETWSYEPLNDAQLVADEIRKHMNL